MLNENKALCSVNVNDIQKAKDFYGKTLGFEVSSGAEGTLVLSKAKTLIYPNPTHTPMSKRPVLCVSILLLSLATLAMGQDWNYPKRPLFRKVNAKQVHVNAPNPCDDIDFVCYTPSMIKTAYDFPTNLNGGGQTIVIVDAYGSPTIRHDLQVFDKTFGIQDPPSFTILCPSGCPAVIPNRNPHDKLGWGLETSLDVEWAHALAPAAKIVLVVAPSSSGNAINTVERKAIPLFPGAILAQSFGIPEYVVRGNNTQIQQAHQNYVTARQLGITVLASTGDFGASNFASFPNPQYPASDPLVTGVGGTEGLPYPHGLLVLNANGHLTYGGEQVWNEPQFVAATGGAPSLIWGVPSFQNGLGLSSRATPDVAFNAAIDGGVLVYDSTLAADGFFIVGGTSASVQEWGAITALAKQYAALHGIGNFGWMNPAIYSAAQSSAYSMDFHDITVGNNALDGPGFSAKPGFDFATGWGTPKVSTLIPDLVSATQ
jgi:subtilase family serine protease